MRPNTSKSPHQSPQGHQRGRTESSQRLREARLHRPLEVADELPVVEIPLEDDQLGGGEFLVELGRGRRHLGKVVREGPERVPPDLPHAVFQKLPPPPGGVAQNTVSLTKTRIFQSIVI